MMELTKKNGNLSKETLAIEFIISIFIILNFLLRTLDHILILILVFFSIPQLSIYHAYYDPLLFLLFFLILDIMKREFFNFNKILLFKSYLLIFYCIFICVFSSNSFAEMTIDNLIFDDS